MHPDTLHRYSNYRASCKQWSVALGVGILLVGALGKLDAGSVLFAALPLLLLGLVEAGYAAQERRCLELMKGRKGNDELAGLLPESAPAGIVRTARAAVSVAVWPFYFALYGIVAAGSGALPALHHDSAGPTVVAASGSRGGCGSGGCGSAKGCGSGGCGASAGKACSCGGGASKPTVQKVAQPVQYAQPPQYVQTANGPVPVSQSPMARPQGGVSVQTRGPVATGAQRIGLPTGPMSPGGVAPGSLPTNFGGNPTLPPAGATAPVNAAGPFAAPSVPPGPAVAAPGVASPAVAVPPAGAPAIAPAPGAPLRVAPVPTTAQKPTGSQ